MEEVYVGGVSLVHFKFTKEEQEGVGGGEEWRGVFDQCGEHFDTVETDYLVVEFNHELNVVAEIGQSSMGLHG